MSEKLMPPQIRLENVATQEKAVTGRVKLTSTDIAYTTLLQWCIREEVTQGMEFGIGDVYNINLHGDADKIKGMTGVIKAATTAVNSVHPKADAQAGIFISETPATITQSRYVTPFGPSNDLNILSDQFLQAVRCAQSSKYNRADTGTHLHTVAKDPSELDYPSEVQAKHGKKFYFQEVPAQFDRESLARYDTLVKKISNLKLVEASKEIDNLPDDPMLFKLDLNGGSIKLLNGERTAEQSFETYQKVWDSFSKKDILVHLLQADEEACYWISSQSSYLVAQESMLDDLSDYLVEQSVDFKLVGYRVIKPKGWVNSEECEDRICIPVYDSDLDLEKLLEDQAKKNGTNIAITTDRF